MHATLMSLFGLGLAFDMHSDAESGTWKPHPGKKERALEPMPFPHEPTVNTLYLAPVLLR